VWCSVVGGWDGGTGSGPDEARDVRPSYDQVETDHWGELEGGQLLAGELVGGRSLDAEW
jgi:hypothetical protein